MKKHCLIATIVISLLVNTSLGQKKYQHPLVKAPDTFRGADASSAPDQTSLVQLYKALGGGWQQ
jgi:hypothetical protein